MTLGAYDVEWAPPLTLRDTTFSSRFSLTSSASRPSTRKFFRIKMDRSISGEISP